MPSPNSRGRRIHTLRRRRRCEPVASARRGIARATAVVVTLAAIVLTNAGCTTHKQAAEHPVATLTAPPAEVGECAPDRLYPTMSATCWSYQ